MEKAKSKLYFAITPYPLDAPWPVMRGDAQNTGRYRFSSESLSPRISEVQQFHTGNGIFSTPVIGRDEIIYVGSADHNFYALDPKSGKELWKFDAGELIDSAAALAADGRIYVPAGAAIYALDLAGQQEWAFDVIRRRPQGLYTFSTNYWWEGNVALGPDGNLYAGNDDFFFYSITPEGHLRWTFRTGFFIWAIPAFALDGTLYLAGFDMRLYALDSETGQLKWKKNLKNSLVASPALGMDGTIYQGSFDGKLYALDSRQGKVKWSFQTHGHIYGSPGVDPRGRVYVTSTDGFLYAVDGSNGQALWTFYTGDAVRSSPTLGPDPEAREEYLIYFGGGQGDVYALEPNGARRWSYQTLHRAGRVDYPNLNASPALGRGGIAVANANGNVFYIPYDYYLRDGASGITRDPSDGFHGEGARWHWVSPGGLIDREPEGDYQTRIERRVHPAQVIILRLIARETERTKHARLIPGSARVEAWPAFRHRVEVMGDEQTVSVVPEEMLRPGEEYQLRLAASYQDSAGGRGEVSGMVKLRVAEKQGETSLFFQPDPPGFVLTHMAMPQPAIVPSLDQIGIAIMRIPFVIVESDPPRGAFLAWAVQKYGEAAGGEEQGVPDSRSLFYAFSGKVDGDFFALESENCFFEASSFPFPLDRLHFSGRLEPDGSVEQDASLWAELDPPNMLRSLGQLRVSSEEETKGRRSWLGNTLSGGGAKGFLAAAKATVPTVAGYITNRIWRPWGFYNPEGKFVGVGTFRLERLAPEATGLPPGVRIKTFEYQARRRRVVAEVEVQNPGQYLLAVGILLKDNRTGRSVPLNYNTAMLRQRLEDGTKRAVLSLAGHDIPAGEMTAYLMLDLHPAQKIAIVGNST